jgi:hypothetical protein
MQATVNLLALVEASLLRALRFLTTPLLSVQRPGVGFH